MNKVSIALVAFISLIFSNLASAQDVRSLNDFENSAKKLVAELQTKLGLEAKIRSVAFALRVDVGSNGKVGGATVSDLAPATYKEYISVNKDKIDLSSLQKFVEARKMVNQSVMIPFYTTVKDTKGNKIDIEAEKVSQILRFGGVHFEGNCYWLKPVLTSFNVPSLH